MSFLFIITQLTRDPIVDQLHLTLISQENVASLDVSVDEQVLLEVDQSMHHLLDDVSNLIFIQMKTNFGQSRADIRDRTKAAQLHHIPYMAIDSENIR